MALGTRTKFQLEILIRSTILVIYKFRENVLESSRNISETPLPLQSSASATLCAQAPRRLMIGLSTHPGTGVDGASGRGWKLADFLLKHV